MRSSACVYPGLSMLLAIHDEYVLASENLESDGCIQQLVVADVLPRNERCFYLERWSAPEDWRRDFGRTNQVSGCH